MSKHHPVIAPSLVVLACLGVACGCEPTRATLTQPTSAGSFTTIRLPREAAKVLIDPLPVLDLDLRLLESIDPLRPATSIDAWHEFQFAPAMTLLRTPPLFTARASELLALVPAMSDRLPPLELDHAFCSPGTDGSIRAPLPDGTFDMPKLGEVPVLGKFSLARLRYKLARLRIQRPPAAALPNSFSLRVTLRDIVTEVDNVAAGGPHVTFFAGMDELAIDCVATFRVPLSGPCGEVPVSCSAISVDVVNLQHNLPVPVTEQVVQDAVATLLLGGVALHFEGFATTGLIVDQSGRLGLSGSPDDRCSHVPAPPPRMAPVRGLVRTAATIGKGELIGSNGSVMPFELMPEVRVDWGFAGGAPPRPFRPWSVEKPPDTPLPYQVHGNELPRPITALPSVIATSVELVQHIQKNCWLKPLGLLEFVSPLFPPGATRGGPVRGCVDDECWCVTCEAGSKFFVELVAPDGTSYMTRDLRVLSGGDRVVVEGASSADFEAEVAPRLTRLDGTLCPGPNCPRDCGPSRCAPWVRLDLVEDALPPLPGGASGPPWEVILWAGRSLETLEHQMGLTPKCPLTPGGPGTGETVVGQRIISPPSVVFGEMMADSSAFAPVRVKRLDADGSEHFTGLVEKVEPANSPYVLTEHNLGSGPALRVELTGLCRAHALGAPHLGAPCWSGTFELPDPGTISPSVAFSATSVGRIPLRTVFESGGPLSLLMVATLGNRLAAVHGTLDRSGLQMFTKVPRIYQDIGLTTARYDFRGVQEKEMVSPVTPDLAPSGAAYFDWEHGPTFPLPYSGDFRHPALSQRRWGGGETPSSQYFADWRSDELLLRWTGDEPFSYCPRLEQLFVSPREFAFTGAGLGREEVRLPATEILESGARGPAPAMEYRVSASQPAGGRLSRVLP